MPLRQVGHAGQVLWTVPRVMRLGPPEVRCADGPLAVVRYQRRAVAVETSDGTWVVHGSPGSYVSVVDAAGTEIAWLAARPVFRLRRPGRIGDLAVHYRPDGLWGDGGSWVDDAGRILMTVQAHHRLVRRWVTCEPTGVVGPGPWAVLLALLTDAVAYDVLSLPTLEVGLGRVSTGIGTR